MSLPKRTSIRNYTNYEDGRNHGCLVHGSYWYEELVQERNTLLATERGMSGVPYLDRFIGTKYVSYGMRNVS